VKVLHVFLTIQFSPCDTRVGAFKSRGMMKVGKDSYIKGARMFAAGGWTFVLLLDGTARTKERLRQLSMVGQSYATLGPRFTKRVMVTLRMASFISRPDCTGMHCMSRRGQCMWMSTVKMNVLQTDANKRVLDDGNSVITEVEFCVPLVCRIYWLRCTFPRLTV
jgi:hypothetical protein